MLTRKSYLMDIDEIEPFPDSDGRAVSSSNMVYAVAADSDRADVLWGCRWSQDLENSLAKPLTCELSISIFCPEVFDYVLGYAINANSRSPKHVDVPQRYRKSG